MKKFFVVLIFVFVLAPVFAVPVTIKGTATDYSGEKFKALIISDYITANTTTIATGEVDDAGEFTAVFDIDGTNRVYIEIDRRRAYLYVEPGREYQVIFPGRDTEVPVMGIKASESVKLELIGNTAGELNALITQFNREFNKFMAENYPKFSKVAKNPEIDEFIKKSNSKYRYIEGDFFQTYVRYKLGSIEQLNYLDDPGQIYKKYFADEPVLYHHPKYMDLYNDYFSKSFKLMASMGYSRRIGNALSERSYSDLLNIFISDTLFGRNRRLGELIMIGGLYESYHIKQFRRENIMAILKSIQTESKYQEHRQIAKNMITNINKLKQGTPAPDFTLLDLENNPVSLSDFKGKYVYLTFWQSNSPTSMQEMSIISKLYDHYKEKVAFVSISVDRHEEDMKRILKSYPFKWTILHYNNYKDIVDDYEVIAVPMYYLIDPEGNLLHSPAAGPGSSIDRTLYNLTVKK